MKGNAKVISHLNKSLICLLTSINQYFLHARMFKNWGLTELDSVTYKESIREMKKADDLISRILFLEGLPNLQKLDQLKIGENTEEILSADLNRATQNQKMLKDSILQCEQLKDFTSRDLLEDLLEGEEEHIDWLETQHHLISNMGIENYLAEKIED